MVRTDNETAKAYVNKQGGTRSSHLQWEEAMLMAWAEDNLASLRVEHLAGVQNISIDWLSR